jgi:aryl-alcohol dehydrogenase-like predicted oxidoreductase
MPENRYVVPYWERLQKLQYDFMNGNDVNIVEKALRFTLSLPVHTAIVGTTKPDRWKENAQLLAKGALSKSEIDSIRERWKSIASKNWIGQV